jgi:hypothetical protein
MAKLPPETLEAIWTILKQLSQVIEDAKAAEFIIFERFGEIDSTIPYLTYLENVSGNVAIKSAKCSPSIKKPSWVPSG